MMLDSEIEDIVKTIWSTLVDVPISRGGDHGASDDSTVTGIRPSRRGDAEAPRWVDLRVGRHRLVASVTPAAVRALPIARGRRVYLYVTATAVRRRDAPTPGSPRR